MTELFNKMFTRNPGSFRCIVFLFCFSTTLILPGFVSVTSAQIDTNPRALAMGGTYTAVARDFESLEVNPANLGLKTKRNLTMLFVLPSMCLDWHNTSFDTGFIDKYEGKYLTEYDKSMILKKVSDGLGLKTDMGYDIFAMSYGRFGMSVGFKLFTEFYLPQAPLELMLKGTYVGQDIRLSDVRGDVNSLIATTFSYAYPLDDIKLLQPFKNRLGLTRTSAGISIKPMLGIGNMHLRTPEGNIHMDDYYMNVNSTSLLRMSGTEMTNVDDEVEYDFSSGIPGSGVAFDLGVAAKRGDRLTFGIALRNLFGGIRWKKKTYEARYTMTTDSFNSVSVE